MLLHPYSPFRNALRISASMGVVLLLAGCTVVKSLYSKPKPSKNVLTQQAVAESWTGTYRTTLPCPDCSGLKLELSLYKDATYKLITQELGTSKPAVVRKGSFTFNADETRITLDASGQNRSFDILSAGRLRMLGKDAMPITGDDSARFILKK